MMPEKYRQADPVESYREYYTHEKTRFAKWRLGNAPAWLLRKWWELGYTIV